MIGQIEGVKIISSFHKKSKPYGKIQSRATNGFLFRTEGCAEYFVSGESYKVGADEVIFLPKGASYEYVTGEGVYTSINFEAEIERSEIAVYPLRDFHDASYILNNFSDTWNFGSQSDKYKCLSVFYDFLSYVSRLEHLSYAERGNYRIIEPAIDYLKKHIYDVGLKVDKLHRLCGISDTYFRRIFVSRFNMTPQAYVLSERIAHAKLIIESGDYDSIKEVAESVGYSDPLYFSKAFKKYYGFPPSGTCE